MRRSLISLLIALISLLNAPYNVYANDLSNVSGCKIPNLNSNALLNIGWPRNPELINPAGAPKFLIIGIDFPDAVETEFQPQQLSNILQLDHIDSFYKTVSNGLLEPKFDIYPSWVTMPDKSEHYGASQEATFAEGEWSTHHLEHDATLAVHKNINLSNYSGIILYISGGQTLSGYAAYATVLDGESTNLENGLGNYIVAGAGFFNSPNVEPWKVLAHEINHLLGLMDLYLYANDGWWKGDSTGPFGIQSYLFESSSDSLAWNRWLLGWIKDSQVACITGQTDVNNLQLQYKSTDSQDNKVMLVKRISNYKVLVMEALNPKGFDASTYDNSILVYTVDSTIPTGEGPVRLVARATELTKSPVSPQLPDWIRFKDAPLIPGTFLEFENLLIVNEAAIDGGAEVSIYSGIEAINKKAALLNPKPKYLVTSVKTIVCTKGKLSRKVKGTNPFCPKGYKVKT